MFLSLLSKFSSQSSSAYFYYSFPCNSAIKKAKMGVKTLSQDSSERQKWDKIFEVLVKMLKTQQHQLETLAKERKILEDRIKMQYERWVSDVRFCEDHISQMKSDLKSEEMARVLEATKADMMVGLKHREAYLCKLKLAETEDELTDFRIWFDILSKNSRDISQRGLIETKTESSRRTPGCSKSVSDKSSQVTAFMAENKFAWNQLNVLESQYTDKLSSKQSELEKANRRVEALISNMEELRSSNAEKDELIERLKAEVSRKEADSSRFREVSKISGEIELLRKSRSTSRTPVTKRCAAGGRSSVIGCKNDNVTVQKESSGPRVHDLLKDNEKGSRGSKRKKAISETPKLFTCRLKASSRKTR